MSKQSEYNALVVEMNQGAKEVAPDAMCSVEDIVSEAAMDILEENDWIDPFLRSKGVTDVRGRLVDDMASGTGF